MTKPFNGSAGIHAWACRKQLAATEFCDDLPLEVSLTF